MTGARSVAAFTVWWIAVVGVLAVAGAARGAPPVDALRLSLDGITWASSIDVPVFDPAHVWVPGDSATAALWVENATADHAELVVDLEAGSGPSLLDVDGVTMSATAGGVTRTVRGGGGGRLVEIAEVGPGERTRVELTFALDAGVGNRAQGRSVPLALVVTLRQAAGSTPSRPTTAPAEPPAIPPPAPQPTLAPSPPRMPATGTGAASVAVVVVGAAALGLGVGLSRIRRVGHGR